MAVFKCKMCGGELNVTEGATVVECDYCGSKQTLPRLDDNMRANLYDRANHFRRNNEYDKAMGIYNRILDEDKTDAEAYWSIVLCTYGIEYVEDPVSHKRVPTVNRTQYTSIFDDANYKAAIEYADSFQKGIYEEEAKAINEIQKGILEISQKEEPFDVFICYKETDDAGRRTPDSVLANDLYHQLIQEGFRVFFSRITLEDKLGTAYEPYIFAALNSAKVMVVLGTKPENFNAVWVKNEWSRYLALIRNGEKKMLIPAYRDMDPYDLPEEFSHLQAQDMSKLGFMQDLIRGIKKITGADALAPASQSQAKVSIENVTPPTESLLKRGFMFCEDGDWKSADEYFEKVLDFDPENAQAYLGKLMAEKGVRNADSFMALVEPFDDSLNYQKVRRFDSGEIASKLEKINTELQAKKERMIAEEKLANERRIAEKKAREERLLAEKKEKEEEERRISLEHFLEEIETKEPGDEIQFGRMEWIVLRREYNMSMLILTDRIKKEYAWDDWKRSRIREWLNGSFLYEKFSEREQNMIVKVKAGKDENAVNDKVFLLNYFEICDIARPVYEKMYNKLGLGKLEDFLTRNGKSYLTRDSVTFCCYVPNKARQYWIQPAIWVNTADTDNPFEYRKGLIEQEMEELKAQINAIEKEISEAGIFERKKKNELSEKKFPLSERYSKLRSEQRNNFEIKLLGDSNLHD